MSRPVDDTSEFYTAVDVLDDVNGDDIEPPLPSTSGWILRFRNDHSPLRLPHHLLLRILKFVLTPIPALAFGYGKDTSEIKLMTRFCCPRPNKMVHSPLSVATIERVRISTFQHSCSSSKSWRLKSLDATHSYMENIDMALKYELHKKIHKNYSGHCIFCSSSAIKICAPLENQLYQVYSRTKALYNFADISTREYIAGDRNIAAKHTVKSVHSDPLEKTLLTFPVHDYDLLKNLRQASKRFHALIENDFVTLEKQIEYFKFHDRMNFIKKSYEPILKKLSTNAMEEDLDIEMYHPHYYKSNKWTTRQKSNGYKPLCGCSKHVYEMKRIWVIVASILLIWVTISFEQVCSVFGPTLDALSVYGVLHKQVHNQLNNQQIWNHTRNETISSLLVLSEDANATLHSTMEKFATVEHWNVAQAEMRSSAYTLVFIPICFALLVLVFRCHIPCFLVGCHGNTGFRSCWTTGSPSRWCRKCFYIRKKNEKVGVASGLALYHDTCQKLATYFLVLSAPLIWSLVGLVEWTCTTIELNKWNMTQLLTQLTANATTTTIDNTTTTTMWSTAAAPAAVYSGNEEIKGVDYIWYFLPMILLICYLIVSFFGFLYDKDSGGAKDFPCVMLFDISSFFVVFVFMITSLLVMSMTASNKIIMEGGDNDTDVMGGEDGGGGEIGWLVAVLPFAVFSAIMMLTLPLKFWLRRCGDMHASSGLEFAIMSVCAEIVCVVLLCIPSLCLVSAALLLDNGNDVVMPPTYIPLTSWTNIIELLSTDIIVLTAGVVGGTICSANKKVY